MSKIEGGCLCGQIRYTSSAEPAMTAVCHCPDCQKQTGTSFSIIVGLPADAISVSGGAKVYETTGDSGQKVHRHFCGNCGSPIMSLVDAFPGVSFLKAGTLDDASWLNPTTEFFCETAQPWVALDGERDRSPRNPPS